MSHEQRVMSISCGKKANNSLLASHSKKKINSFSKHEKTLSPPRWSSWRSGSHGAVVSRL